MKKKYILAALCLLLITQVMAQPSPQIKKLIEKHANSKVLNQSQWSVYARYVKSGQIIADRGADQCLAPASGLKLFTTAAALDILGSSFRFQTRLYYAGEIDKSGILHGSLYIVGGGDPTLGSNTVNGSLPLDSLMEDWTMVVKGKGFKGIAGSVIADDLLYDRLPIPDYWSWIDIGNYYAAPTSALSLHDNLYYLFFKPGAAAGDPTTILRTEPPIAGLTFTNYVLTGKKGSGDNAYIDCAPGQFSAMTRGTIPAGNDEFSIKGAIPDPALFAAQYFTAALIKSDVTVKGIPERINAPVKYDPENLIHTSRSPELKEIVYMINKRSNNLYTEQLLKYLAVKQGNTGSTEEGITAIKDFLARLNISTEGLSLSDGCGLSRTNTITTKMMVELLCQMTAHPAFNDFYNSLGIAGDPQDISFFGNFGKGTVIAKNARIKSGLIAGVRSHSGYVKDRSGDLIAFSFIVNNYTGKLKEVDAIHEALLIELGKLP